MPGLKYLFLTCLCIILYTLVSENTENEPVETYANGNVADNFSIGELISTRPKTLDPVRSEELRIRSDWTYEKGAGVTPVGSEERVYAPSFPVNDARFICWELIVEHKPASVDRNL